MGKYYWLKLPRDFFKRHDMIILESMENGWIFEMIFVKLLAESIDHDGELRFSDSIPYDSRMLSSICRTDEETMKAALTVFQNLGLIHIDKKKTLSVPIASKMIGSAEDNDAANRQRRCRARKRENSTSCDTDVTECHNDVTEKRDTDVTKDNESKSKSKSKSIDKEKEEKENNKLFSSSLSGERPSKKEVVDFCRTENLEVDPDLFFKLYESQNWTIDGKPIKNWKALLVKWDSGKTKSKQKEIPYMENDYDFSQYDDPNNEKALKELDEFIAKIREDEKAKKIIK